jgi:hypothetical protein
MAVIRTHFTFRVDTWTPDGESIVEHVADAITAVPWSMVILVVNVVLVAPA